MNTTSFFYAHTDQWRYETLDIDEILSPTAPAGPWDGGSMIDYNVRAERMGWLPSAPQLADQSAARSREQAAAAGMEPKDYVAKALKAGDAEAVLRGPRQSRATGRATCSCGARTCWAPAARATSISSSTCSAPRTACMGKDLGEMGAQKPTEVVWHDEAPEGKLDLLVTLDFRMSHHLPLLRHRAADRHLVREERPQHLRHASRSSTR